MKQVTTLRAWLSQVPPCKIVAALDRDANNSTRDKKRLLKKLYDLEKIAKAQGAIIEVILTNKSK
jgi:hypothetical protein